MKKLTPLHGLIAGIILILVVAAANVPIKFLEFQSDVNGGNFCITNLSCLDVGSIDGVTGIFTNLQVISNLVANGVTISASNLVSIDDGYTMPIALNAVGSNSYWEDYGQTNTAGFRLICAKVLLTNDMVILGQTNMSREWLSLSYVAVSSIAPYSRIYLPTNGLAHFQTNYGAFIFWPSNQWVVLYLTNGFKMRMSTKTNAGFLERQWNVD